MKPVIQVAVGSTVADEFNLWSSGVIMMPHLIFYSTCHWQISFENGDLLKLIAKRPAVTSCKAATPDRFLSKILKTTNIFPRFHHFDAHDAVPTK